LAWGLWDMTIHLPKMFLFIRHAIAVPATDANLDDAQRPLTPDGSRRARQVLRRVVRLYQPSRVLCSPAVRTVETARLLIQCIGKDHLSIETTDTLLPDGTVDGWRGFLRSMEPELQSDDIVAIVGHEPSISTLLASHLGITKAFPLKKAGVAVVRPEAVDGGELVAFIPPKVWMAIN